MRRLLAWFRAHRIITWGLRVVLVVWGIQLWMNWAAEREWRQYCEEARARGVKLSFSEFAWANVPDAENFALLPMFKAPPVNAWGYFELPTAANGSPISKDDAITGKSIDWTEWQQAFKRVGWIGEVSADPVADVLRGLDRSALKLGGWREWRQRPNCRFPFDPIASIDVREPAFRNLKWAIELTGWRMRVHLEQGDPATALEEFRDILHSYRAVGGEPAVLAAHVRGSALWVIRKQIGTGLARHAWPEAELRRIDAELAGIRIWDDYLLLMSTERALNMDWMDRWLKANRFRRAEMFVEHQAARLGIYDRVQPVSWVHVCFSVTCSKHKLRENQLRESQYVDELLARLTVDGRGLDLDRAVSLGLKDRQPFHKQWRYALFKFAADQYDQYEQSCVSSQTGVHELRLAIALERFHLAHGIFPEQLNDLVPAFLTEVPNDPWSGKPMMYRREKKDSFVLYSTGEDRRDDGGVFDSQRDSFNQSQRDRIWRYAPP